MAVSTMISRISLVLRGLAAQEEGQDLVEYALVLMLVFTAVVATMHILSQALLGEYQYILTQLQANGF